MLHARHGILLLLVIIQIAAQRMYCMFVIFICIETFYVATTGNDANAGTLASPFATIDRAFQSITQGRVIEIVDAGTYTSSINYTQAFDVKIRSTARATIQSVVSSHVLVHHSPATITIEGVNIVPRSQIAILVDALGALVVDSCIFTAPYSNFISATGAGNITIRGSSFSGLPTVTSAAHIFATQTSTNAVMITNCQFLQTYSGTVPTRTGGAVSITGGMLFVSGTLFSGTHASSGGGIYGFSIERVELSSSNFTNCVGTAGAAFQFLGSVSNNYMSLSNIVTTTCESKGDAIMYINGYRTVVVDQVKTYKNYGTMTHFRISSTNAASMTGTSVNIRSFEARENVAMGQYATMLVTLMANVAIEGANNVANNASVLGSATTAINLRLNGPSTINNMYCANNTFAVGGCLYITGDATLYKNASRITNSIFERNRGPRIGTFGNGASIYGVYTSLITENCIFRYNSGRRGAGVYLTAANPVNRGNSLTTTNCTFYANTVNSGASAIYVDRAVAVCNMSLD